MANTPIVLIHGFPLDSTMWAAQAAFLRSAEGGGHAVLTPDVAGFGAAGGPAPGREKATVEGYAEAIHALIQEKCGGRAIVGGFSMGGYILLALLRDYPGDVAAAMFIDTRAEPDTAEARANRLKSIEEVSKNGPPAVLEGLMGKLFSKRPSEAVKKAVRGIMDKQSAGAIIAAQSAMAKRRDQSDLLPELQIPVLVVVGAEDGITPPSVALAMQSHMPHAMVVQIVSAGHMSPMEQPDAVNGAMKAFLAAVGE
jgi:pimeloyl-ACP methyl ester carboxylesterase